MTADESFFVHLNQKSLWPWTNRVTINFVKKLAFPEKQISVFQKQMIGHLLLNDGRFWKTTLFLENSICWWILHYNIENNDSCEAVFGFFICLIVGGSTTSLGHSLDPLWHGTNQLFNCFWSKLPSNTLQNNFDCLWASDMRA